MVGMFDVNLISAPVPTAYHGRSLEDSVNLGRSFKSFLRLQVYLRNSEESTVRIVGFKTSEACGKLAAVARTRRGG